MATPTQPDARSNDFVLHSDLTGLRADMQETNRNVERIATTLETLTGDHETRIRSLEASILSASGVINLMKWLGPSALIAILALVIKGGI